MPQPSSDVLPMTNAYTTTASASLPYSPSRLVGNGISTMSDRYARFSTSSRRSKSCSIENMRWCESQNRPITAKLRKYANSCGQESSRKSWRSASGSSSGTSMPSTSTVIAIANTPSVNATMRAKSIDSRTGGPVPSTAPQDSCAPGRKARSGLLGQLGEALAGAPARVAEEDRQADQEPYDEPDPCAEREQRHQ